MSNAPKKQKLDPEGASDPTKPLPLQRRRVWRACESCRRKKIKCDGREPTCGQCVSSRTSCTWIQTKDRAALSRHYVQELEQRLLHMESLLAKVVGQSQGDIERTLERSPRDSDHLSPITAPQTSSPQSTDIHSPGDDHSLGIKPESLNAQLGELALDDHGHLRWIGSSSTMSLIQSFRALTAEPVDRYSPPQGESLNSDHTGNLLYFPAGLGFGKVRALPGPQEVEYPERDLADKLVSTYFDHLHFLLPVVHKPSFLKQYEELMNMHIDDRADASFVSVLFGVFACAARILDDKRLFLDDGGGMSTVYYERAMILYYIGHSNTQVAQVQCFVILASFLCSVNCLPQAWLIVGQAVRIAQDLGLHRTPNHLHLSHTEKQTRRKVWWSVYSLDRMLAIALGRPLGVDDRDCDAEFPLRVDDDDLEDYLEGTLTQETTPLMVGFVALSALFKLGGDVLRCVYSVKPTTSSEAELQATIDDLDAQLTDWCEQLPLVFKCAPTNEHQMRMGSSLASSYYALLITLHRKSLSLPRMGRNILAPGSNSVLKAVQSARACIRLAPSAKDVLPSSHHLAFFVQFLSTSAVIVLLFAMHAPDDDTAVTAMNEVRDSLVTLQTLEGRWPGARKCTELLDSLVEVTRGAMKHGNREWSPPSKQIVEQDRKPPQGRSSSIAGNINRSPQFLRDEPQKHSVLKRHYDHSMEPPPVSVSLKTSIAPFVPPPYTIQDANVPVYASTQSSEMGPYQSEASSYRQEESSKGDWRMLQDGASMRNAPQGSSVDPRFLSYSPSSGPPTLFNSSPMSPQSTPPTATPFDMTGLPFAGLDFLQSFTPAGYSGVEDQRSMEVLWQTIGPSAFNFDPELQFAAFNGGNNK